MRPEEATTRPVRVCWPVFTLVPGEMGGTETYASELGRCLDEDPRVDLVRLHPAGPADPSALSRLRAAVGAAVSPSARRAIARIDPDVVHYPFTVPVPPAGGRPWVTSLHDVQHLDLPENFARAERAYRRVTYDLTARRADLVITLSEFSKSRIVDRLDIDPARIVVVPLGVAARFTPYHGPREPFVLYPARRWPHKNHDRLVAAVAQLRQTRPELRLVLTGGGPDLAGAPAWVEQRGMVSGEELVDLYRAAACLAFPSLYEGFGMPPLEAMAAGCPVAVSATGSLPEVVGDAAVTFDPRDVKDIARGIAEAMGGRDRLVPLGLAQARKFTWDACAEKHVACYRRAYNVGHRRTGREG